MPQFTPKTVSDPSNLSHGRHPGFLLAILVEEIPEAFIEMKKKDTHMFRWMLAVWEHESHLAQYAPEEQSAISSRAFSPKGKFQASKAYVWTGSLLGREIPRGQGVDLDPMLPLACHVDVERTPGNDYCKITALWGRPEGQGAIPPVVHQLRAQYAAGFPPANGTAPAAPAPQPQSPPPLPPPVQQWGQPGPQAPPSTQPAGWPQQQAPQAPQPVLPGSQPKGTGVPF